MMIFYSHRNVNEDLWGAVTDALNLRSENEPND